MKSSSVFRRLAFGLLLCLPMLTAVVGGAAAQDEIVVRAVTDTAGLGDQNFNDLANAGGLRAEEELGVDFEVFESQTAVDYIPNLTAAAEEADLTIGIGFLLTEAIVEVAQQYPDSNFMLIDGVAAVDEEPLQNVASVLFREEQAAFLAGVVTGLTTESNIVGFVGGEAIPPVVRFEVGFKAGVMSVNPDAEILTGYADTFQDPALGRELTLAQYNQGADIVHAAAGLTGVGAFDAAEEMGAGYWVVAADTDQSQLGADFQLCVAAKGVDTSVFTITEQVVNGEFEGGIQTLGLAEGGVGLGAPHESVSEEILGIVAQYEAAIIDGGLTVPVDQDTLTAFEPIAPEDLPAAGTPAASTPDA